MERKKLRDWQDSFTFKIERMVQKEVEKRVKIEIGNTVDACEYFKNEMFKVKKELVAAERKLKDYEKEISNIEKEAIKKLQKMYCLDVSVGDMIYLVRDRIKYKICPKRCACRKIEVVVDGIKVSADCPVCGTYEKRKLLEYIEYTIVAGKVDRVHFESTGTKSWVRLSIDHETYSIEDLKYIARTREEAEEIIEKLKEGEDLVCQMI